MRRAYVIATLDFPNTRHRLVPLIRETWNKLQLPTVAPNAATVIRWKSKFLRAGKDITSLIEKSDNRGNSQSRYPEETGKLVEDAIDRKYMCLEQGTLQDAVDEAIVLAQRENNLRPTSMQLPLTPLTYKVESEHEKLSTALGPTIYRIKQLLKEHGVRKAL